MTTNWRDTLAVLLPQFQELATRSRQLKHALVEAGDAERDRLHGPPWLARYETDSSDPNWSLCGMHTLPITAPSFREPYEGEDLKDASKQVIRDAGGTPRAVFMPLVIRSGNFYGQNYGIISEFTSLANAAATALTGADDIEEHFLASELRDTFRRPRGLVRYAFGDVPELPTKTITVGWNASVLTYDNGVVIDVPIADAQPDAYHWLFFLHQLAWRRLKNTALHATRMAWGENTEAPIEMLQTERRHKNSRLDQSLNNISTSSYYSILGNQRSPLDVCVASALAIQILLSGLQSQSKPPESSEAEATDYSNEPWSRRQLPQIKHSDKAKAKEVTQPKVGVLIATEVERDALLKAMRPPRKAQYIYQVFSGQNTFYLGRLGDTSIVACMSSMGSVGRDSASIVTSELITDWSLKAVVMAGIAFGKDAGKQQIGQVLVSDKVIQYERQRVGESNTIHRGDQPSAGGLLLNRFRNVLGWTFLGPDGQPCIYQVGPILSGEKLVDDLAFRDELFEAFPAAIGGEMEGSGFASAADRNKCEWIVVKGICDWADGAKTKFHQPFAAAAAVSLIEHVFNQPSALDAL